jgi:hypothetical protein
MSDKNNKLTVFLDYVGRTIIGEIVEENDSQFKIKNPVILSTVQTPDNRMSIQLFPLLFREFLADKEADVIFPFNKSYITPIHDNENNSISLDFRLQAQYSQIFNKSNLYVPAQQTPNAPQQNTGDDANVVKLFDE